MPSNVNNSAAPNAEQAFLGGTILASIEASMNRGSWQPDVLLFYGNQAAKDGTLGSECLSQWFLRPFRENGVVFPSAEHYMMAQKAKLFGDEEAYRNILDAATQGEAKAIGRRVKDFDQGRWNTACKRIVAQGNYLKFTQHPDLQEYLLATKDKVLAEASRKDSIWGIGLDAHDPRSKDPRQWNGSNLLGFALMAVRERIRCALTIGDPANQEKTAFNHHDLAGAPSPGQQPTTGGLSARLDTNHSSKPNSIQPTAVMADNQPQGGQIRPQTDESQKPAPDPIDTNLPSPLGAGNIIDLGNRFHVPGSPTKNEEVYKFVNGRTFNAIEMHAVALAKKTGMDMPRFSFRKSSKEESTGRITYLNGARYEAPAELSEQGIKVVIVQKEAKAPGEENGQSNAPRANGQSRSSYNNSGQSRGGYDSRNGSDRGGYSGGNRGGGNYGNGAPARKVDTGVECMFGKIVRCGNKFLIGEKEVRMWAEKGGKEFTPQDIKLIVDSKGRRQAPPIMTFPGREGQPDYDRAVDVNLDTGIYYLQRVNEQGQHQGGREQGRAHEGQERSRPQYQQRGGEQRGPIGAADFGDGEDDANGVEDHGGEETDGESMDIPDDLQPAQEAPQRGGGRSRR